MGNDTMKAVVFHGPGKVTIEDRPVPQIKESGDIIVKVDKVSALCQPLLIANTL
jgi:threonine dehydrogenase-like Zn-dependent dehydrogenase